MPWYNKIMIGLIFDVIEKTPFSHWVIMAVSFAILIFYIFLFAEDTKKRSGKFFLIFSFIVFVWGVTFIFFDASLETPNIHTMVLFAYFWAGFVAPALFIAIDSFSNENAPIPLRKFIYIFGPYVLLSIAFLIPRQIVGYQEGAHGGAGEIVFGPYALLYVLYIVVLVSLVLGILIKRYRQSAGIFKLQMRDLLATFVVTATVALVATLFLPFFTGLQNFFWFGYAGGALVFLVVCAGIIIRYNFWSFKIITSKFFITIIFFALLVEIFFATSTFDLLVKLGIVILVMFASFFLVGSLKREVLSNEIIGTSLGNIDDLRGQLKVLDKKKSEFLSIASHHLRDPLTVIKGYASMLSDGDFGELPPMVKESVDKIFDSSGRLISMISDFMDISRIESGDMNYIFSDVDIKKLMLEVAGEMRQSAERAHLSFSVTIDEGDFITVGDEGKLRQVISNLIDNSIKYTPKGEISLLLYRDKDDNKILISLSDTGIGMNEFTKQKIFKKFSRAEGVSKTYTEGTGLGLYVALEIIKKHDGKIWAESRGEGQGSSFYVELTAKKA